jgi:Flp pilus assembly protein TadG
MITHPKTAGCIMPDPAPTPKKRSAFGRVGAFVKRAFHSEIGTASIEFVICVPVIMTIFMASIESGAFMTRLIMLEQSVDKQMRSLRLGQIPNPTAALLKSRICDGAVIMKDCAANITVDLQPVSTTTWAFPSASPECVNRDQNLTPATTFNPGVQHEIMMVRVCVIQDAIFPLVGLGLKLSRDASGGYALATTTAFVNEP